MTSVAVLGPGGVGGFLAGALANAGEDVTVVAREETSTHIAQHGLQVESVRLGSFDARPRAVSHLDEPVDVLFLATKATGLAAALERVRAEPDVVVPLLNGLAHRELLRERFGERAVAGAIRIESDRPAPGRIVQTSPFLVVHVASEAEEMRPRLSDVVGVLEAAGVAAEVWESEAQVAWSKLARLCPLALTTTAYDSPIGPIRTTPELRAELRAAVEEACAVGAAEGADLDPDRTMGELDDAHAELGTSMQRDVRAGREPELDAIAGSVIRAGATHGVDTPTITSLATRVAERAGIAAPAA